MNVFSPYSPFFTSFMFLLPADKEGAAGWTNTKTTK